MDYKIQIEKTVEAYPISIVNVARQCRVILDDNPDTGIEEELNDVLKDAIGAAEDYIGADIAYKSCVLKTIMTPYVTITDADLGLEGVYVKEGNLASIDSVKIAGTEITTDKYKLFKRNLGFVILFEKDTILTDLELEIAFHTGFDDGETMPRGLRKGCLILSNDLYTSERSSYAFAISNNIQGFQNAIRYLRPHQRHYY
jgi:hypothetical protein